MQLITLDSCALETVSRSHRGSNYVPCGVIAPQIPFCNLSAARRGLLTARFLEDMVFRERVVDDINE